jgi:CRISPR type III-associated protein (TIGR04423 family)
MKQIIYIIPEGNYNGYIWLSNSEEPEMVKGSLDSAILEKGIPFIVEGFLYDKEKEISIEIRHNGKQHVLTQYNLYETSGYEFPETVVETHRLAGAKTAKFINVWKEEPDNLCAGMKTLKPFASVFAGF